MGLLNLFVMGQVLMCAPWYDQKMQGWYYFQDNEENQEELLPSIADEILDIEKKKLQELLSLAILSPTQENVQKYLRTKQLWLEQSEKFAEACSEGRSPIDPIDQMSDRYFLLLFFKEEGPAVQTAQKFAQLHGWKLKGVALGATRVEGLDTIEDQGISEKMKVTDSPAFFVVDPERGRFVEVGTGHLTLSELEKNIMGIVHV